MNRAFIDMDGVLADFERLKNELGVDSQTLKTMPGAYRNLLPIPGAIAGVKSLIGMGLECWVASKPPTAVPQAYADKAAWVLEHLPELKRRIILTHDKGLLGDSHDFLIDDRPHKANCERFPGRLIRFGQGIGWREIISMMREYVGQGLAAVEH